MNRVFISIVAVLGFALMSSCQKAPSLVLSGPTILSFTSEGGSKEISFTTNRPWSITSESWCEVSPSSGTASNEPVTVTVSCDANTSFEFRACDITVKAEGLMQVITVRQDINYGIQLSQTSFDLSNEAQTIEVDVRGNIPYDIEIDALCQSWISQVKTKAPSSDKITFSIAANTLYDLREGTIRIKPFFEDESEIITIRQSHGFGLFVSPSSFEVGNDGDTIALTVRTNENYSYAISEDAAQWIVPVSSKGLTESTLLFDVLKNEDGRLRVGTITIIGDKHTETVSVCQSEENPSLILSKKLIAVDMGGGTFEVEVKSNMDVQVSIPYDCDWIKEISGKAVTTGVFTFWAEENSKYSKRETELLFTCENPRIEEKLTVVQVPPYSIIMTVNTEYEFEAEGGELVIDVSSNTDYQVQISDNSWISLVDTKSVTNNTCLFHVARNDTGTVRMAEIRFVQGGGSLTETVKVTQFTPSYPSSNWNDYVSCRGGSILHKLKGNSVDDYEVIIKDDWISLSDGYKEDDWCVFVFYIAPNENSRQGRSGEIQFYYQGNSKPEFCFPVQYAKMPSVTYTTNRQSETVPVFNKNYGYHFGLIDWGDGFVEEYKPGLVHTYKDSGEHTIVFEMNLAAHVLIPFGGNMRADFSEYKEY